MTGVKVELVSDWQPIDVSYEKDDFGRSVVNQGIWFNDRFIDLDMFVRYGTVWVGDAPRCFTETGEEIKVQGVSTDSVCPYLIEINDETGEIRVWKGTESYEIK